LGTLEKLTALASELCHVLTLGSDLEVPFSLDPQGAKIVYIGGDHW
jgi:hypothetical protein